MEMHRISRMEAAPAPLEEPRGTSRRSDLAVVCSLVGRDPRITSAYIVLPRRLQYGDLGPFQPVQRTYDASLRMRDDGGFDIVVADEVEAKGPSAPRTKPARVPHSSRHAPTWVMHLMQMTEGVR